MIAKKRKKAYQGQILNRCSAFEIISRIFKQDYDNFSKKLKKKCKHTNR